MPRFIAITSRGLLEPLAAELESFDLKWVKVRPDSVEFDGPWADAYRVHLQSRLASRILLPVCEFTAYNEDDLYHGTFKKHDFTQYIEPTQTIRIEAHTREHRTLRDQRFVAMKVKDAVVDQFWKKFNQRPDVGDEENADLRIVVRVVGPEVSLALDLTGDSLSYRGYRQFTGAAPVRENVGAGLVRLAGWEAPRPLVDPFCGSGTVLIEAALMCAGLPPTRRRRRYAFERLRGFQQDAWQELQKPPTRKAAPAKPFLFGYDKDSRILEQARLNARSAGVENWISFQPREIGDLKAPAETGLIITNPPYGERIEDVPGAKELMNRFSQTLKSSFKGWDCWILSGNPDVIAGLRLKAKRRVPIWNGPIECRFLHYPLT